MTETTAPSMIDVDLDDAKPLRCLPDNSEALLEITRAELVKNKSQDEALGVYNLRILLDCGESDVDDIMQWIPVPNEAWKADNLKSYTKAMNRFKEFCQAVGMTPPLETGRVVGLSGMAIVGEEEDDRNPGTFRNTVRSWVSK